VSFSPPCLPPICSTCSCRPLGLYRRKLRLFIKYVWRVYVYVYVWRVYVYVYVCICIYIYIYNTYTYMAQETWRRLRELGHSWKHGSFFFSSSRNMRTTKEKKRRLTINPPTNWPRSSYLYPFDILKKIHGKNIIDDSGYIDSPEDEFRDRRKSRMNFIRNLWAVVLTYNLIITHYYSVTWIMKIIIGELVTRINVFNRRGNFFPRIFINAKDATSDGIRCFSSRMQVS